MRKILVVLLACILLCGCSVDDILDKLPEKTYEHGDVSITLPNSFMDYSSQDMAEGKDFLFANSEMGIAGVREDKKELYEAFGEMDAEGYANLIAELYELDASAAEKDGHWSFTYEQEIDGKCGHIYVYSTKPPPITGTSRCTARPLHLKTTRILCGNTAPA